MPNAGGCFGQPWHRQHGGVRLQRKDRLVRAGVELLVDPLGHLRRRFFLRSEEGERDRQQYLAAGLDRLGEIAVWIVVGKPRQGGPQLRVGDPVRRRPGGAADVLRDWLLRLGEQQVEADDPRLGLVEPLECLGEQSPAQRPAAERGEAAVVDQHDHGVGFSRLHPAQSEAQIERSGLKAAQHRAVLRAEEVEEPGSDGESERCFTHPGRPGEPEPCQSGPRQARPYRHSC